jgi:hypothetical protein
VPAYRQKGETVSTPPLLWGAEEAIERLVPILRQVGGGTFVFCTCLDADGFVGDSECFASPDRPLCSLPVEHLFTLAAELECAAVLFSSRADEADEAAILGFTERLIAEGRRRGVEIVDHVVVYGEGHRRLRETTDLWTGRALDTVGRQDCESEARGPC